MFKNILPLALSALFLTACANKATEPDQTLSLADDKSRIVGIWAMVPLRGGIANVAEYRADGKVLLHPFNCAKRDEDEGREVEVSDYRIADDGQSIHIKSPMDEFDLKVLAFERKTMRLGMSVADMPLTFSYIKVDKVAPLCFLFSKPEPQGKQSAYVPSDFVAAPALPAHANLDRYLGKWALDGELQIEIVSTADGGAQLYMTPSENWNHLYNDVHWEGDALHYQSYAYSDKPELFRHPYHKTQTRTIITPMADGTLQHSFFIHERRFDYTLERVSD